MRTTRVACVVGAVCLLGSSCLERKLGLLQPCTLSVGVEEIQVDAIENVDLLFVIDDSGSMDEEQTSLRSEIPRLVGVLATGDTNFDPNTGEAIAGADFPPIKSLNVAVVSTDMGDGGAFNGTCDGRGGDGEFRSGGFLQFNPVDGGSPADFARDVANRSRLGTGGCGLEQQLEATMKALSPSNSEYISGHGDGVNAGFLRDTSLLVIIVLTDEDDCSASDPEIFRRDSPQFNGADRRDDLNVRCAFHPEFLRSESEIADALVDLRANPNLLIFATIAGIPLELASSSGTDYGRILADSRMQEQVDEQHLAATGDVRLKWSCNQGIERGVAFPPTRILRTAQALESRGATTLVQSICQEDFRPAISAVIDRVQDKLRGLCLPRPLAPDGDGKVECKVLETLPRIGDVTRCDQLTTFGRKSFLMGADGRETCEIQQSVAGATGWFYDDSDAVRERCPMTPQRVSFTSDSQPVFGATVRLECVLPVEPGRIGIGSPCTDTATCDGSSMRGPVCEPLSLTCQQPCANDSECPASFVCSAGLCVNPTCNA